MDVKGDGRYRCPDCGGWVRLVPRRSRRFRRAIGRVEDADSGAAHACAAKPARPIVAWLPCACGEIVHLVSGVAGLLSRDCTPHACPATRRGGLRVVEPADRPEAATAATVNLPPGVPVI